MIKLNTEYLKQIFTKYDYIMTTAQLNLEKLYYRDIQQMLKKGMIEKVKRGYYHWIEERSCYYKQTIPRRNPLHGNSIVLLQL